LVVLALLWSAFLVRGFFYAAILPIWEGYDEPYHFAYIEYLVARHTTPTLATGVSRQIDASLHVLPLPWMLTLQAIPQPLYSHDKFWEIPPATREFLQKQFRGIPPQWARQPSPEFFQNYEAQQPPLYYLLCWPLLLLLKNQTLATQVLALRCAGIILASLAVPLGFGLIRRLTRTGVAAFSIPALIIVMPELCINLARVGNEVLSIVLYTALLYALVRFPHELPRVRMMPVAGILIGLGLLTKAYFLTAVPAFFLIAIFFMWRWPEHRRRIMLSSLVAALCLVAIAAPWYFHVHKSTGSWSGLQPATVAPHSLFALLASIPRVNWRSGVLSIVISHVWFGAWSFLRVPKPFYFFFGTVYLLACAGLICMGWRIKNNRFQDIPPVALISLCLYAFFCLGLAYDILLLFVSVGASSSTGWYMYSLVVAEVLLLYFGLRSALPANIFRWAMPLLVSAFALLDLFGSHFLFIPYYAGLISHDAAGQVSPATITALVHFGQGNLLQRLAINKSAVLSTTSLGLLWSIYIVVTILAASMSWRPVPPKTDVRDC
jgi:4-amino-4-deoxy-L-arabinose transferase-like glycosyltransferase